MLLRLHACVTNPRCRAWLLAYLESHWEPRFIVGLKHYKLVSLCVVREKEKLYAACQDRLHCSQVRVQGGSNKTRQGLREEREGGRGWGGNGASPGPGGAHGWWSGATWRQRRSSSWRCRPSMRQWAWPALASRRSSTRRWGRWSRRMSGRNWRGREDGVRVQREVAWQSRSNHVTIT